MKPPRTVYVLGMPEAGGCWSSNGHCYLQQANALKALDTKYAGLGMKCFTFEVQDHSEAEEDL